MLGQSWVSVKYKSRGGDTRERLLQVRKPVAARSEADSLAQSAAAPTGPTPSGIEAEGFFVKNRASQCDMDVEDPTVAASAEAIARVTGKRTARSQVRVAVTCRVKTDACRVN